MTNKTLKIEAEITPDGKLNMTRSTSGMNYLEVLGIISVIQKEFLNETMQTNIPEPDDMGFLGSEILAQNNANDHE